MAEKKEEVALSQSELWIRTVNPEKFRQLIADRTQALLQPGREEELGEWLDRRAAADEAWEVRQAKFEGEMFAEFLKELGPPAAEVIEESAPYSKPRPEELSSEAQRVMAAWNDPKIFDEVMEENRRLNAAEAERRGQESPTMNDLKVPAAMEDVVEELRAIIRSERLSAQEVAGYLGHALCEIEQLPPHSVEVSESHYPPDASQEEIAVWRQQENDQRMEAAAKIARENVEHVEMMQRHSLPTMTPTEKQALLDEITQASASLSPNLTPTHDPPEIKL